MNNYTMKNNNLWKKSKKKDQQKELQLKNLYKMEEEEYKHREQLFMGRIQTF